MAVPVTWRTASSFHQLPVSTRSNSNWLRHKDGCRCVACIPGASRFGRCCSALSPHRCEHARKFCCHLIPECVYIYIYICMYVYMYVDTYIYILYWQCFVFDISSAVLKEFAVKSQQLWELMPSLPWRGTLSLLEKHVRIGDTKHILSFIYRPLTHFI